MYCVYKHTSPNGKVYIGITKQYPLNRWHNGYGYRSNPYFFKAIIKYGWDNFKHEILFDGLTKLEAESKEIELIAKYKSNHYLYGYNLDNGGNCIGSFSEEHKRKISIALRGNQCAKGRVLSKETKEKISRAHKGKPSPLKGSKFTKEHCEKISKSMKGKNKGVLSWRAKRIQCIETGEIFNCIVDIRRKYDIDFSSISKVCLGKRQTAGGYHWRYL